jgi:phage baseplate assembly protein W
VADFGIDIACVDDLDPGWELVSGRKALGQALARRLSTPRGGLFYAPTYGYDLRAWLNADLDAIDVFAIAAGVEAECERDPRVQRAAASVSFESTTERLRVTVYVVDAEGPFELVLDVSAVTVEILKAA